MTTYEAEQKLRKAKELLKEAEHLLRTALWVNYRQEDAAAVLREKIDRLLGGDE